MTWQRGAGGCVVDIDAWLTYGLERGWCGPPVCATHDGTPTSEAEDFAWEEYGEPPCMHILRLYEDDGVKVAVEANHSPSTWRQLGGK